MMSISPGNIMLWCFSLAAASIAALFHALPYGLAIHVFMGNPPDTIADAALNAGRLSAGLASGFLALAFGTMAVTIWSRRGLYRRNHDATMLARKFVRQLEGEEMSAEEQRRFAKYREQGVLTFDGRGVLRISDRDTRRFWE